MFRKLFNSLSARADMPSRYPGIPDDLLVHVIGDIHGCLSLLKQTIAKIEADRRASNARYFAEIYLGDYVDRGPDSAGVIEVLMDRQKSRKAIFIKGNHDAMLEEYVRGSRALAEWLPFGGADTLRSYGATPDQLTRNDPRLSKLIPAHHLAFLTQCEPSFQIEDYFFTHAGVRPGVPLDRQTHRDLMWIRDEFLTFTGNFGAIIVHGHSPVERPDFRNNRIGIDTGAYMTGHLCCLRLDGNGPVALAN